MEEVRIESLDHQARGRGIGIYSNKLTFVKNVLPGEMIVCKIIKEKAKYNIGELVDIEKKSLKRVDPVCPYYKFCGGCHLQHINYQDTILFKKDKIINILRLNQINYPEIQIVKNESPFNYRNKLSLKIVNKKIGFFEENSHDLIAIDNCRIAKYSINEMLDKLNILNIKNGFITIRSNYNDELLLIIETEDNINFKEEDFQSLKIVGIVLNNKTIYGQNFFYERIENCLFKVSYNAFFQINHYITEKLFQIIKENINEESKVLDLYSGVGTLGIIASKKAQSVYSIEIVKNAVLDNIENKKLNKCSNVEIFLGDAPKVLNKIKIDFDTIIIDPPRKGLDSVSLNMLLNSKAKNIIYISCDPLTLARDLKKLVTKYNIEKYYILDMFSYTYHVECVVLLNLKTKEK